MRHRTWIMYAAAVATMGIPAASSMASAPSADPQASALNAALALMREGRAAEASAAVDPIIAAYDRQYATEKKRQIYCGMSPTQTLLYMMMATTSKRDAVAVDPNWCTALFLKGFSLVDQKQVAAGLPYLIRAVEMAPSHSHYLNELGYAYQVLRRWPESLDAYTRAADSASLADKPEQKKEQTRAWRGAGYVLVEQGKWDEAVTMYRKCLKLDPNDAKAKGELQYIAEKRPKGA